MDEARKAEIQRRLTNYQAEQAARRAAAPPPPPVLSRAQAAFAAAVEQSHVVEAARRAAQAAPPTPAQAAFAELVAEREAARPPPPPPTLADRARAAGIAPPPLGRQESWVDAVPRPPLGSTSDSAGKPAGRNYHSWHDCRSNFQSLALVLTEYFIRGNIRAVIAQLKNCIDVRIADQTSRVAARGGIAPTKTQIYEDNIHNHTIVFLRKLNNFINDVVIRRIDDFSSVTVAYLERPMAPFQHFLVQTDDKAGGSSLYRISAREVDYRQPDGTYQKIAGKRRKTRKSKNKKRKTRRNRKH